MKTVPIVPSPLAPSFLAKLLATGCLISVATVPWARAAGLIDEFSYPDGGLTAVSGGAWQLWEAGAEDAAVSGGAMRFQGNTDVIRTLPPGAKTTFKVTFKAKAEGTRSAAILIKSNYANESPFDLTLTGIGALP